MIEAAWSLQEVPPLPPPPPPPPPPPFPPPPEDCRSPSKRGIAATAAAEAKSASCQIDSEGEKKSTVFREQKNEGGGKSRKKNISRLLVGSN